MEEEIVMPSTEKTILEPLEMDEFELPVGYVDSEGNFHKTVKLQEMTGEVEEAMAEEKVRNNFGKVTTELIYGITERIGSMKKVAREDIRKLSVADRDFILLMNYLVSIDSEIVYDAVCTKCGALNTVTVEIEKIPVIYFAKDDPRKFTVELPRGIKSGEKVFNKVVITLPDGITQEKIFPILEKNPAQAGTLMLAQITEDIPGLGNWNYETFQKMGKKDRNAIADIGKDIKAGPNLAPTVECSECGKEFEAQIPIRKLMGE